MKSYTGRFVSYLREHRALDLFDFFSFEWYPFDDVCADPAVPLAQHPTLLADIVRRQEEAGLPPDVPKVITEYGYSSFAGQVELELPGSIVNAETAAQFLALGGDTSYFYGLEPNWVFQEDEGKPCNTWGNLMLFQYHDDFQMRPVATFHASQLVTGHRIQAGDGRHEVRAATTDLRSADGHPMVTAYGLRRPDGRLAVLLFDKDPARTVTVELRTGSAGANAPLAGDLELFSYSGEQWDWYPEGGETNSGFPVRRILDAHKHKTIATLRADGSPRISGIECEFADGELTFGFMAGSRKGADLRRDGRFAVHSTSVDPPEDTPAQGTGDAKVAGFAEWTGPLDGEIPGDGFRADVTEVVLTGLNEEGTALRVESWHEGAGVRRIERA